MIPPKGASPSLQGPALETLPWLARFCAQSSLIARGAQPGGRPIVGACFGGNGGDIQSRGLDVVHPGDGPVKASSGFFAPGSNTSHSCGPVWAPVGAAREVAA